MTRQTDTLASNNPCGWAAGLAGRIANSANKSLPKENARLVRQVIGGLAGLSSAACVVTAYLAAEKARKEQHVLNKVLVGAAAAGTAAAALELGVQSSDLLGGGYDAAYDWASGL